MVTLKRVLLYHVMSFQSRVWSIKSFIDAYMKMGMCMCVAWSKVVLCARWFVWGWQINFLVTVL